LIAFNPSKKIVMIGPDPEGMGGISRVVKIWQTEGWLYEQNIEYIPTVSDSSDDRFFLLFRSLLKYIFLCVTGCEKVYIHTASRNSFFRKSIFIAIGCIFRKKMILHIHPSFFYTFLSSFIGLKKAFFFMLLGHIQAFVVLTEDMKSKMGILFPNKVIHVMPNPINVKKMANTKQIPRKLNSLLYLGWYVKSKGVFDLVDAIQLLIEKKNNVEIDFYGTKGKYNLRAYVQQKELSKNIRINGWIDDAKKLEALYKSTMLVLPSYTEGIPNVIIEAMATKTPIVSTSVGGLKEILKDSYNAIIADPRDPNDLSEKIFHCLEDMRLRQKISINAYKDCCAKYDVKIVKSQFVQILNSTFYQPNK
jgi:glycosyltransferase involved in cell wall biosynthesis